MLWAPTRSKSSLQSRVQSELELSGALPTADTAYVDMDEVRGLIVAHSASVQGEGCVPQPGSRKIGQANVDGFGLYVEAVLRDPRVGVERTQEFVRLGRAISADHIDLVVGLTDRCEQVVKQVEEARVVVVNFAGPPVAEVVVKPIESLRDIGVAAAIDDVDALIRMSVEEAQAVLRTGLGTRGTGDGRGIGERHDDKGKTYETQKRCHFGTSFCFSRHQQREIGSYLLYREFQNAA
jgi:hypothetical protein